MSPDGAVAQPTQRTPGTYTPPPAAAPEPTGGRVVPAAIRLRPRSVLGVLDTGFDLLGRHWLELMAVTLAVMIPLVALPRALVTNASGSTTQRLSDLVHVTSNDTLSFGGSSATWLTWVALTASMLATGLVGIAVSHLVSGWVVGRSPTIGDALRLVGRRGWVMVVSMLATVPMRVVGGVACGVGLIFVMVWLLVLAPVIALEGVGPMAAIGRSFKLTNRRWGPNFGVVVVGGFIVLLATAVVGGVLGALAGLVWDDGRALVWAVGVIGLVVTVITVPLQVLWAIVAYFDLRVRTEGLDLELQLVDVFAPRPVG